MAYEKTVWVNGQAPALDAAHLNKIEQGIADAVSVTPQTLSDEQKAQARGNINAAPGGYGLGETIPNSSYDADTITESCFFFAKNNTPTNDWCFGLCISRNPDKKLQIMWSEQGSGYGFYDGCYAERIMKAGIWGPWEWVNPPMVLGVEYRTTERYLGKPVYVQAVNFGALPNAATKTVIWATADEVSAVLSVEATGSQGAPVGLGASLSGTEITATTTTLYIKSSGDYSANTAVFRIKYTKTTD